ncbi:phosphomannomutase/phosphoglucomutase [Patescibacteria group bacterium]|nr:MAG: phosphomannomutase/phosphoglucomutase [Patescibacteria group bacterium]
MSIPRHIFKQYDIRGLMGEEITEDLAENIGRAYAQFLRNELPPDKPLTVVIGRDMRESSVPYQNRLMAGLVKSGVRVLDIGLVSTPAFYFGVGHLNADGGIMVSASHNPAQYNGFKLTRSNAVPISGETGIQEIAKMVEIADPPPARGGVRGGGSAAAGSIESVEGIPELAARAEFEHAGTHPIKNMKIVVDTANGMGAQYLDEFFKLVDADVTWMFRDFDGSFPNHEADPFKEENTEAIREKVLEIGADLGITTDGDGDRIFFVDDKGRAVTPAVLRGLLAQINLRDHPGATVCYDIRPGKITQDMIVEAGGIPSVTRVGHSLIKEQMRSVGAVFGGESSGHFFYAFPTGVYEGPVTVATQILQEVTRRGMKLSEIVEPLERYVHSGEMNFTVQDKDGMMKKLVEKYHDGELTTLDGITITYPDFWFNVRASNTEPKLRLNLEALDRATMESRRDEIVAVIKENA